MTPEIKKALDLALEAAYLAGFNASGEGYNGEFPFADRDQKPQHDPAWCKDRDNAITAIKQARSAPVQEPVAWLTEERYAQLHTAQRQWVGLTDEERCELLDKAYNPESYAVFDVPKWHGPRSKRKTMSNTNTGGPAFPGFDYIDQHGKKNPEGMTLRDYFAAKAMEAFANEYFHDNSDVIADKAYTLADAMMKAREA